jgi:hypothetical protein
LPLDHSLPEGVVAVASFDEALRAVKEMGAKVQHFIMIYS